MKKIYHLSTCTTCQRIIKELQPLTNFVLQDIKTEPITTSQLEEMHRLSNSYEALFSKRAVLYRERNLKEQNLSEDDFKALILEQYTFLKRPVIIVDEQIFIGNSKKVVEAAKMAIHP
ncbi:ArsC/Spx/MgsR family protein [Maribacter sp. SA7]|uniref:arsenate reductase family protein n=1 Tax=Maribacter zhoushanensis TaxID=3030012 RepID=UPI0023EC757A|nr:ArsC/Spx/MgsR family protein [Maribacter zhoushanensis]MDF4203484.1 ArsC/Spx/MgsR family protein [Maribacter zhoushanensis]